MHAISRSTLFFITAVALALSACGGGGEAIEEQTISADGKDEIVINIGYGDITVEGKDGATDIVITPTTTLSKNVDTTYSVSEDGSTVNVVSANIGEETGTVDVKVTMPPEMQHNLISAIEGNVSIKGLTGSGTINTEKGNVTMALENGFVSENVNATSGDVSATFPADFAGEFTAQTDDGALSVEGLDIDESALTETSASNVEVGGGGEDKLIVTVSAGNIDLSSR